MRKNTNMRMKSPESVPVVRDQSRKGRLGSARKRMKKIGMIKCKMGEMIGGRITEMVQEMIGGMIGEMTTQETIGGTI